jgi:hypothetical protein
MFELRGTNCVRFNIFEVRVNAFTLYKNSGPFEQISKYTPIALAFFGCGK